MPIHAGQVAPRDGFLINRHDLDQFLAETACASPTALTAPECAESADCPAWQPGWFFGGMAVGVIVAGALVGGGVYLITR